VAGPRDHRAWLNWDKRYITLAPVATVIGLAFRMFDPDKLLGPRTDLGITCALIPRDTRRASPSAAATSR
jgi:alkylation response protein AidB-like acyl-CoA dehydrogenase